MGQEAKAATMIQAHLRGRTERNLLKAQRLAKVEVVGDGSSKQLDKAMGSTTNSEATTEANTTAPSVGWPKWILVLCVAIFASAFFTAASSFRSTVSIELAVPSRTRDAAVVGSWDDYGRAHPMAPHNSKAKVWAVDLSLPRGRHEYRFIVDGRPYKKGRQSKIEVS